MKDLTNRIIYNLMRIDYWYSQNILPYFERRRAKKEFMELKKTELALLMLLHQKGNDDYYNNQLVETRIKLDRFKDEKFYTLNLMSINGRLPK